MNSYLFWFWIVPPAIISLIYLIDFYRYISGRMTNFEFDFDIPIYIISGFVPFINLYILFKVGYMFIVINPKFKKRVPLSQKLKGLRKNNLAKHEDAILYDKIENFMRTFELDAEIFLKSNYECIEDHLIWQTRFEDDVDIIMEEYFKSRYNQEYDVPNLISCKFTFYRFTITGEKYRNNQGFNITGKWESQYNKFNNQKFTLRYIHLKK